MNISRRFFLTRGGVSLATIGAGALVGPGFLARAALAAVDRPAGDKRVFVCLFQRGAADGLSMVVPHGDPFYYQHRNEIAIGRPSKTASGGAIDLDGFFGLHPAMKALTPLYKSGELAMIHACGSPSSSRSHFDMQDFMEAAAPDNKSVQDGWLNRTLRQRRGDGNTSPFRAVSMTSTVPRSLQGDEPAIAIRDLSTFGIQSAGGSSSAMASGFEGLYANAAGDVLHGTGKESFDAIALLKKADPTKYVPAKSVKYPDGAFGRSLMQVAQLIKADVGLEIACVEVDGWDTHVNQGGANGTLAGRLFDLSRGLAAFRQDLGDHMDEVMVLTMTEFGRAARQNGDRGTDHGHASCFFALGGRVNGGKVHGSWPGLAPHKLFEERDLAVTTDFRDVFAEVCTLHMGLQTNQLASVFPRFDASVERFRGIVRV